MVLRNHVQIKCKYKKGVSSYEQFRLDHIEDDAVVTEILEANYQSTALPVQFCLFQGLPKKDKLELIIEKNEEMRCCVMKPEQKREPQVSFPAAISRYGFS